MGSTHNSAKLKLAAKFKQHPPRRILVIITRRIGDVLLTTPLIHTLKTAWPEAKLDVLVLSGTRDILSNHPDIHQTISRPNNTSKLASLKWMLALWRKYDLAISALPSDRATLYAWLAGKYRIGMIEDAPKQGWKKYLLHDWVAFDNINTHTVNMALQLASHLGLALQYEFNMRWTAHDSNLVDELFASHSIQPNQPYAVLHVYPKFSYKMWHPSGWKALVDWLQQQNIQVVLTGSSDPSEMHYIQQLLESLPPSTVNLAGELNFAQMTYLLKKAALYVGPDTVATHLAAAMGTPTLALFGPSNPVKWGPWPQNHRSECSPWQMTAPSQKVGNVLLLQGLGDCVPCHLEGCERHTNSRSRCLDELPASRVITAINSLLS
ncbi:lipopolysaccharide core heptosyltransferase RfaQ [mine drainage metagenome]|uniref:Lipopolysaccharide core heptosyltransferase RfaQ n=1 Tax=mine drainage metagenome TaxID=410659 RepID=A0A1J5S3J1_9ZZZZ